MVDGCSLVRMGGGCDRHCTVLRFLCSVCGVRLGRIGHVAGRDW